MACTSKSLLHVLFVNRLYSRTIAMSAQRRAQEAMKELKEKNPFFEKYAQKIAKLQQTSLEDFLERVDKVAHPTANGNKQSRTYSELLNPKQPLAQEPTTEIHQQKLSDIMKLDLVQDKTADEIKQIWFDYHKTKDNLSATLRIDQYEALMKRAKDFPIFLLPLPRSEGFEFVMLQFAANTVHFTPLIAYQVHKENAPECLTLVHYSELKDKGLILMRGEYDNKVLTAQEAQCLANQLQMFYYKPDANKLKLLETFTKQPNQFKHMDLINEFENIQLV